jgi:hydrogenase maturation protease
VTSAAAAAGPAPFRATAATRFGATRTGAETTGRYAVLGLGNLIQGDDALGGHVVARLLERPELLTALPFPDAVELIDGGTVGLGLIPYLVGLDGLIVVDIIDAGAEPGTVVDLDGASVLAHEPVMGVHDLGAEELLGALLFMDALPRRVRIVGIQPAAITLGTELSPEVGTAAPGLIDAVVGYLADWQAEDGAIAGA